MRFFSTRGGEAVGLIDAVMRGLAPDGGLYVPDALPRIEPSDVRCHSLSEIDAQQLPSLLPGSPPLAELAAIAKDALDFPVPLKPLDGGAGKLAVLELFHGPTAAFKDVGVRFLAALMERALPLVPDERKGPLTILVATSGDTGGAVAAAFHG